MVCKVKHLPGITGTINSVPSGLTIGGKITIVSIDSASWTALPATPLTNRNAISVQNISGVDIKLQYDNTVATYTGVRMAPNSERFYNITDSIILYAKSSAGTVDILVEEIA